MAQLAQRFIQQPRTQQLDAYITRKYSKYGYSREHDISYNPEFQPKYTCDRYRWVENVTNGLRKVGDANDIVRLNHTGWYIDNWQDETVHGEVYQLPARNGECQYVPAVNDPCNDGCACLDFSSVTDDKEDAARWADSMAERWAEDERECQAKADAEDRLAEIETEIKDAYTDFRRIAREIRANCDKLSGISVVRELVREHWHQTKQEIRKLRREQERIEQYGMEY